MKKELFYDLLKNVPKAELHIHEEAVISRETVKKIYSHSFNKDIPQEEFDSLFDYDDLAGFLNSFLKIQSYFTKVEDLTYMFDDFSDYLTENNIVYCEAFVSPTSHLTKKGWKFPEMMSFIDKSLEKIKTEENRIVKIIIDVSRSFGEENAMNNLNHVLELKDKNIIGIGLGGDEAKGPAKDYQKVFEKAQENGLLVVSHAGEICNAQSIKDSLEYLHSQRIGHGITAVEDKELMKLLKEQQIPLEVCPTSNIFTKKIVTDIKKHPVRELYDEGLMVTINTDDPTFFKVSLIDEYWNIYSQLNFTLDEILDLIKNSFRAANISEKEKQVYLDEVQEKWDEWFASHGEEK